MERLQQLIGKLNEQFAENVDPAQLLVTIKLIEAELVRQTASQYENSFQPAAKSRVSVVMPPAPVYVRSNTVEDKPTPPIDEIKEELQPIVKPTPPAEDPIQTDTSPEEDNEISVDEPELMTISSEQINPLVEVPTLAHQQAIKELNEIIGQNSTSSLNERLKSDQMELGLKINATSPVKDLKKAIGINERYAYINELFRGDEPMFERSLKTINSFKIYAEAAYWIERELKVKLGWDESKDITQAFYQLVRRRFQ